VAGLDDNVFADTLFGHLRGAFTGAEKNRSGMVEQAAGGTLFLDEIGDLSITSQVKLLRLLQEGEYFPLGSDRPRQLQARILCATHQDLEARVAERSFRKDLFFRLQTHQVTLPPLRDRREDLSLLVDHFLQQAALELGKKKPTPPKELLNLLANYSFPGNVRELRAMVFDAVSAHRSGVLSMASFRQRVECKGKPLLETKETISNPFLSLDELPTLREADGLLVDVALERAGGNQTLAARILGIAQPSLSKRLKRRRT
jgi:DNA-binding NtrC family response regulator